MAATGFKENTTDACPDRAETLILAVFWTRLIIRSFKTLHDHLYKALHVHSGDW